MNFYGKTVFAVLVIGLLLQAGCGSNFEWFPKNVTFVNSSTSTSPVTRPGTVMRTLVFPSSVKWVSDIAYVKSSNSFWLLAGTTGDVTNPDINPPANALVQVNVSDGSIIQKIDPNPNYPWSNNVVNGSALAYDGTSFWITSNGYSAGSPVSEIYQLTSSGLYFDAKKYSCPATSTGFCQGLALDSNPATYSYWSAGSDSARLLANYSVVDGVVTSFKTYANLWSANGVSDVAFDSATGEVFVVKNGIIRVSRSGAYLGSIPFTLPGTGRGDWDGTYFWVVDNSSKSIKALFVR